jgi:hypothetical protein
MAVVLRYYEGLSGREIAEVLETTTKAVERLLARGRSASGKTFGLVPATVRTGKTIGVGLALLVRNGNGVGSRFRVSRFPCGRSLPENDSRPLKRGHEFICRSQVFFCGGLVRITRLFV